MLSFALFGENGSMENEAVESFTVLGNSSSGAGHLSVKPTQARGLSFLLGTEAEAALELFEMERIIRVDMKDGSTMAFRVPIKGYRASKAMFDACVRVLRDSA